MTDSISAAIERLELAEATGIRFCDQAKRYLDAIAEKEGWTLEPARCPGHRERA